MAWERGSTLDEPQWTVEEARQLTLDELHSLWIELGRAWYKAEEIRKILPSGHSYWVIQNYLRENGGIPSLEDEVLKQARDGKDTAEIANAVRVTPRRVQQILRKLQGPARTQRTTKGNIDLFLSDPEKFFKSEFTQKKAFRWGLLKRCVRAVDENPRKGLQTVRNTVALFDRIKRTRRKEWTKRLAECLYVQSRGIESHVYAETGEHRIALQILSDLLFDVNNCLSCEADRKRRIALVYYRWNRLEDAWLHAGDATDRYRELGTSGHDLYGNGLANCHLLNSHIHYEIVSPEAGAAEARTGLSLLTGKEAPTLLCYLVFALARCLMPSTDPREIDESERLLGWCFNNIDSAGKQSEARAMLHWLKGQILTVRGLREEAIDCFTLALEDAQACHLNDVGDILEDLAALNPDPILIRNHIEDFCDWDEKGNLIVPCWCKHLENEIRPVYDLVTDRKAPIDVSIFSALRKEAGRERRMPSFMIPPSSSKSSGVETWDALR